MLTLKYEEENLTTAYLHLKSQFIKKISTLNPFSINLNKFNKISRKINTSRSFNFKKDNSIVYNNNPEIEKIIMELGYNT